MTWMPTAFIFFISLYPEYHFVISSMTISKINNGATVFIFLDTETTRTAEKDRLCQFAHKLETVETVDELFKPPLPISVIDMIYV